jgi:hypothetical protein
VRLSVAEIKRLLWGLVWAWRPPDGFVWAWSRWRRTHQARATLSHYQRRGAVPHDLQL